MSRVILEFSDILAGYGQTEILRGVSGVVYHGQTLGIFGRNGVGKTTLARTLAGEITPSNGTILAGDRNLTKLPSFARRRLGMSYMPQTGMVFDSLTVRENLSMSKTTASPEPYFEVFPRLGERLDQLAGSMSGGERKILSFVRVMMEDTDIVVLDEPSEGVQPENIENMQRCILEKQKTGCAFILIEQNLAMLQSLAQSYVGLDAGRVVFEGSSDKTTREDLLAVLAV